MARIIWQGRSNTISTWRQLGRHHPLQATIEVAQPLCALSLSRRGNAASGVQSFCTSLQSQTPLGVHACAHRGQRWEGKGMRGRVVWRLQSSTPLRRVSATPSKLLHPSHAILPRPESGGQMDITHFVMRKRRLSEGAGGYVGTEITVSLG